MKKPLYSIKLANWTWIMIAGGAATSWLGGAIFHYAPLYTLYWPLPVDFTQFDAIGGLVFIVGIAVIMIGTLSFIYNIFATVFYTEEGHEKRAIKPLLISALGIDGFLNIWYKITYHIPPRFIHYWLAFFVEVLPLLIIDTHGCIRT